MKILHNSFFSGHLGVKHLKRNFKLQVSFFCNQKGINSGIKFLLLNHINTFMLRPICLLIQYVDSEQYQFKPEYS